MKEGTNNMTQQIQWLRPSAYFDFKAGFEKEFAALQRDMTGVQTDDQAGQVFIEHAETVLALMRNYVSNYNGPRTLQRVGLEVGNGQDRTFTTTLPVEVLQL